jgi:serine/threonine-protein kinase
MDRLKRVQALFDEAVELEPAARRGFLYQAANGDETLITEVEDLLRHDDESNDSLYESVQNQADDALAPRPRRETIGKYRVLRELGQGGMGTVYLAVRNDDEYRKEVAIKLVPAVVDRDELMRRFRAERQIMASLEHPNIARLLDGDTTRDGVPYVVMEYVQGQPIDAYSRDRQLSVDDRLGLFLKVCAAISHAHRNLVVHRDIKPGNILVTDDGEPKLLDFGIAKILETDSGPALTRSGMRLMTPEYASPEQARGEPVNTSSDVYSLGVLLGKLLTDALPYDLDALELGGIEKVICEQAPARPSTLADGIDSELDDIVMMALRKEPDRRYPSVDALAEDIRRYRADEPIHARADTIGYRFSKFLSRNRAAVLAATAVACALVGIVSFYTVQLARERDIALDEQQKVGEVVGFVTGLFEISDPYESRGQDIRARDLLEAGRRRISNDLVDRPALQATMMRVLGEVYYSLNSPDESAALLTTALERQAALGEEDSLESASIHLYLGRIYQDNGDYDSAGTEFVRALEIRRAVLGDAHEDVMTVISAQAFLEETKGNFEEAGRLHENALAMARSLYPEDHVVLAESLSSMAGFYRVVDDAASAEPLLREAIAMLDRLYGGEHPLAFKVQRQLAGLLRNTRRLEEAEPMYEQIIAGQERMLGPDHHELASTWNGYSQLLSDIGDRDRAIEANFNNIRIVEKINDGPHPSLGPGYNNHAFLLRNAERFDEAIVYFKRSLEMQDAVGLPPDHVNRTFPSAGLASVYYRQGRYEEAEPIFREMLEIRAAGFGESHRLTSEIKSDLAAVLTALGNYDAAETLLLDVYPRFMDDRGVDDPRTQRAARRLAELYEAIGEPQRAAPYRDVYQGEF